MEVISLERSFVIRKDPRNIFEFPNSACKIGLKIRLEKPRSLSCKDSPQLRQHEVC
ncbi:hypothetical protein LEP1GSC123_0531 [Leptospira borgpetersenii str. 200701203]|uniref:Uncharacterized protein n=1 Tax=Leptospira borgpetersenii str. 200701203 TaxID=1193007 RepID=M3H181_LEPBO|nr:hypothetical protein LEP1GSC123_0531 [Leptospira borgpetersenii str. 200701203]